MKYILVLICSAIYLHGNAQNKGFIGSPAPGGAADSMGLVVPTGEIVIGQGNKAPNSTDSLKWNDGFEVIGPVKFSSLSAGAVDSILYVDASGFVGKTGQSVATTPAGASTEIQFNKAGVFGTEPEFTLVGSGTALQMGLGIAVPAAASKLHIHTATAGGASTIRYTNSTTGTTLIDGFYTGYGSEAYFVNYENTPIQFYTNGLERLDIMATGQLQIPAYDAAAFDATPTKGLGLDASENIVTYDISAGSADSLGSTVTAGYIVYGTGTKAAGSEAALFYDASTNELGIGTNNPATTLDVFHTTGAGLTLSRDNVGSNDAVDIYAGTNADGIRIISGTAFNATLNSSFQFWDNGSAFAGVYIDACASCDLNLRDGTTTNFFIEGTNGNVGIGTSSPDAAAILDLSSTTKGLKLSVMTTTQRDAISSPPAGLLIYNTTTTKVEVYNGAWTALH